MIAFDSNLLIYFIEDIPEFAKKAENTFLQIEKEQGVCSSLVITESLYGNITNFEQLGPLLSPSIQIVPVTLQIAELAGQLKVTCAIKNADAIHLATAIMAKADKFVTNDQKLLKKKVPGIEVHGLR